MKWYRLLLRVYPREFRLRWEEELLATFAQQAAAEGPRAWADAIADAVRVGCPQRLFHGTAPVVMASLAGTCAVFYGLLWTLANPIRVHTLYHELVRKFGG